MRTIRNLTITTMLGLALALSACQQFPDEATGVKNAAVGTTSQDAPAETKAEKQAEKPAEPDVAKIGQTWTYKSGLEVTVVSMKKVKIGQYAAGGTPNEQGVLLKVKIKNGTTETFDSAMAQVDLKYGSEGENAEAVFDSDMNNTGAGFDGTIRVGKNASALYEFAIPKSGKKTTVDITVTADWDSEPAEFTGKI